MKRQSSILIVWLFALAATAAAQSPAVVERDLLAELKNVEKYGSYSGEFDEDKNDAANKKIKDQLVRNGGRLEVLKYNFPTLKKEMDIVTSTDGRLRIYSWDLQTGGTMHDYENVFQYQGASGRVYAWTAADGEEGDSGSFFTQIFQVNSKDGPVYVGNSTSIAEGSLHGQSIETMTIRGEKFERNAKLIRTTAGLKNSVGFSYDPYSARGSSEKLVFFDPAKQSFRFPVVVEGKDDSNGRITNRFITYRFNGQYFVKVS